MNLERTTKSPGVAWVSNERITMKSTAVLVSKGPTPAAETFTLDDTTPPVRPAPPAPPKRPPGAALFPNGNFPQDPPADLDLAALELMASVRGLKLEAELLDAIGVVDGRLQAARQRFDNDNDGVSYVQTVQSLLRWHTALRERLHAVRAILDIDGTPIPELKLSDRSIWVGQSSIKPAIAKMIGQLRSELAPVLNEIDAIRAILADDSRYFGATTPPGNRVQDLVAAVLEPLKQLAGLGGAHFARSEVEPAITALRSFASWRVPVMRYPARGCQDLALDRLANLLRRKQELEGRIAELTLSASQASGIVADQITAAVKAAGGADKVVESILAAHIISGRLPRLSSFMAEVATEAARLLKNSDGTPRRRSTPEVIGDLASARAWPGSLVPMLVDFHATEGRRVKLVADQESLTFQGIDSGAAFESLQALEHEITGKIVDIRSRINGEQLRLAAAMLEEASSGDEPARAKLENLTSSAPGAFAKTFGPAIAAARLDKTILSELAAALAAK
jgi:hypothetical protein